MTANPRLLSSPLHNRHVAAGAKFAAFGGWLMPLEFSGVLEEHTAVRSRAGLFDVSHLGKIEVTGSGAVDFLNRCLTNDLRKIGPGQAQYSLICAETGGVVDDLIAYVVREDFVLLVPNAANNATVLALLAAAAPEGIQVTNRHRDYAVLAVQGPASDDVLARAGYPVGHRYLSFVTASRAGHSLTVCRTGYTGERGYELIVPVQAAAQVWDELIAAGEPLGLQRAGLGARDTLRTEMGYPLHGQDISLDITPVQARLGWAVGWSKESFFGDAALRAERAAGPARLLRGILAEGRGIPRPGMRVLHRDEPVGVVTSGTFSPTLRRGIGLALVDSRLTDGEPVRVDIRGRHEPFVLRKPPFVQGGARD